MFDFWEVFISFLLIHIVFDFYLLPSRLKQVSKRLTYKDAELYLHSLIYGAALIIPALILGIDWRSTFWLVIIMIGGHLAVNLWKVTVRDNKTFSHFLFVQSVLIVLLGGIAFHMSSNVTVESILAHERLFDSLLVAVAYLVILKPTSVVIGYVLSKHSITEENESAQVNGLIAGGELIGYLERILILTFTLVGSYAAVGFVLAAKSIFRFGDLSKSDDRSITEYVLIGTLTSVVVTTLLGAAVSLGLDVKIK